MLAMSKLIAAAETKSTAAKSRIGFATEGGGKWAEWDRFITLNGKRAYHIGNICGTCAFFFERLPGANDKLSPTELSALLKVGLTELNEDVMRTAMPHCRQEATMLCFSTVHHVWFFLPRKETTSSKSRCNCGVETLFGDCHTTRRLNITVPIL